MKYIHHVKHCWNFYSHYCYVIVLMLTNYCADDNDDDDDGDDEDDDDDDVYCNFCGMMSPWLVERITLHRSNVHCNSSLAFSSK